MNIYCQGQIVEESEAKISANDHGFLYGASLFETFRTSGGKPFLLREHLARLKSGCLAFGIVPHEKLLIAQSPDHAAFRKTLNDLLEANELGDAVFRYTLTAGECRGGLPDGPYWNATELIFVRPLPLPLTSKGICLQILNTSRTEPEVFPRPKSGHYMNSLAGHRELGQRSSSAGDEGLMLTADGRISEGVVSNIFLIAGDVLYTPPLSAHILPGVTRNCVLTLARKLGISAAEKDLGLCDLTEADAIFTTNSARGIVPVFQVLDRNETLIWKRDSGDNRIVKQLLAAYASYSP